MSRRIIFRADGNSAIGFGHFYRLLSLAGILREQFTCVFAINSPDEIRKKQATQTCHELIVLDTPYTFVHPDQVTTENQMPFDMASYITEEDIVLLDGYHFLDAYQRGLHEKGVVQVCIDDHLREYPYAWRVINHAPGINTIGDQFCTGLAYAILRQPFFQPFDVKKNTTGLFLSMGGSDSDGLTATLCEGLLQSGCFSSIHVIITDMFREEQISRLQKLMQNDNRVRLHKNLDAHQIVEVMSGCRYAYTAASTVLVEAYARGLKCFAARTAINQTLLYKGFTEQHLAIGAGEPAHMDADMIAAFVQDNINTQAEVLSAPLQSDGNFLKLFQLAPHA